MLLLAEAQAATVVFLLALAITAALLLLRTQGQLGRNTMTGRPGSFDRRPAERVDPPPQVARYEAQMRELARELSEKVDSKFGLLEHLIRDLQQQGARLEGLFTEFQMGAPHGSSGSLGGAFASQTNQASALTSGNSALSPRPHFEPPLERRYDEIYALADAGQTSAAIAGHVGTPVGEIELILGLRHKPAAMRR